MEGTMLAKVWTCAVVGLDGELVQAEVDISHQGIAKLTIVGLPDTAVQEAGERVRAAIRNSGCLFPQRRITVNLAPADIKKEGPPYETDCEWSQTCRIEGTTPRHTKKDVHHD